MRSPVGTSRISGAVVASAERTKQRFNKNQFVLNSKKVYVFLHKAKIQTRIKVKSLILTWGDDHIHVVLLKDSIDEIYRVRSHFLGRNVVTVRFNVSKVKNESK
jgi:hypothetical protein